MKPPSPGRTPASPGGEPARLVAQAWGVTREWAPLMNVPESPRRYVLVGKPFVPFEEQGRTLAEIERFYPAVDRYWA